MNFQEFIEKYDGKAVDNDGAYGYQCMDLMHYYVREVLGLDSSQLRASTAYNSYLKGGKDFDKIDYAQGMVPQNGDIMYWNTEVGPSGHVAIFIDGNDKNFTSFDQNWPVGTYCHKQPHDYRGVAGWLRDKRKNLQNNDEDMTPENQAKLDELYHFMTEFKKGIHGFYQRSTDGAIFFDAKTNEDKKAKELEGTVYADSSALAAIMRAAGIPQISEEESKEKRYVRVISARDFDKK